MINILDSNNVFDYLTDLGYCNLADRATSQIKIIPAKNFNLLITFADGKSLLVKQEIHDSKGRADGEFHAAWRMKKLVDRFTDFGSEIDRRLPELLYFDPDRAILIVNFLTEYEDLSRYYFKENQFPIEIARSIGDLLAIVHSRTFQRAEYCEFLTDRSSSAASYQAISIIDRLAWIGPQVFAMMPPECLQFFKLYQRLPSLSAAIADLGEAIVPSCLVHNDLKLNNILLDHSWQQPESEITRFIDWERCNWGDPVVDLGNIIGSYLEIWLAGLVISSTLNLQESLQLATTPLELIQPSLFNLVRTYLDRFPEIIIARPDYLDRVIQFAGLALIRRVEITIEVERTFGNRGIIMLQVGKQLLCAPQAAMNTLFGSEGLGIRGCD